jgi:hypothetical protein
MSAYTADGRRKSSMTHASRGHTCPLCGHVAFGNGGKVAHARGHVRRGEAIEMVKEYPTYPPMPLGRVFLAPDDPLRDWYIDHGFAECTDGCPLAPIRNRKEPDHG